VLLQPELLDAYASALVIAAKDEPDGLGSIAEERALSGQFHVPEDERIGDRNQEQLLLHATVEELVRYAWRCGKAPLRAATSSFLHSSIATMPRRRIRREKPWP